MNALLRSIAVKAPSHAEAGCSRPGHSVCTARAPVRRHGTSCKASQSRVVMPAQGRRGDSVVRRAGGLQQSGGGDEQGEWDATPDDGVPLNVPLPEEDMAPVLADDWREFRARLIAQQGGETNCDDRVEAASSANLKLLQEQNPKLAAAKPWAHEISRPEKGCLLVACEDEFQMSQQYFHQAVILVLEHHDRGSMGVILNRPTQYNMGYVSGDTEGPFSDNALYFGGDVGDGTVSFLHGSEEVNGSVEVRPGVFLGGYESACELVNEGAADPQEFKFFARYCGWAPHQLEAECQRGVWHPVACCKELALKQVIQLPKPLWREILELCGGELEEVAQRAYGEINKAPSDDFKEFD